MTVTNMSATAVDVRDAWIYIDPPYDGTTGYLNKFSRSEVVDTAKRLSENNNVCVSEAQPISELIASGWCSAEFTRSRVGQFRKNSISRTEWITWRNRRN